MTKYQVHDYWREHILPFVRAAYENDGVPDLPARRESFNNLVASLERDGQLDRAPAPGRRALRTPLHLL
jgi:hypothetical protein